MIAAITGLLISPYHAGAEKLLLLGDIHYDRIDSHDMEWLAGKGDDLRQVTQEYCVWTRENYPQFAGKLRQVAAGCNAAIQLGDLSEGLAGNRLKAEYMAHDAIGALDSLHLSIPFIMVKGNHDITGPGAKEAFRDVYLPAMSRLTQRSDTLQHATYATAIGNDLFVVCYDPWDKSATPELLDSLLQSSAARHKFVALHEPVIPVNHRCWHVYRKDAEKRNRLLKAIARNHATVLCAHLHKYSVVSRRTPWGPIVQIMVNSVIRNPYRQSPAEFTRNYGQTMFDGHQTWQPASLDQRRRWIEDETPYIDYYVFADIPGYATLSIDGDDITLHYFYGCEDTPIDSVNITKLYSK